MRSTRILVAALTSAAVLVVGGVALVCTMAIALGIRLGKPGVYALNAAGRVPEAVDTLKTIKKASNVLLALVLIACSAKVKTT